MSTERHHSDPRYYERDYALDRLIMLSDGVFAIAMTLMALEVRPEGAWVHTLQGLLDAISTPLQWFFWSFFGTAIFWTVHRRLFGRVTRSTPVLTALNIFLLGQITLIPVATRMVGELQYIGGGLWLYLGVYGLIGVTSAASWLYTYAAGIITQPRPGAAVVATVAVNLAVLPVGMTALGVLSASPNYHWLPALMPVLFGLASVLRRLAEAFDRWRLPAAQAEGKTS